MILKEDKFFYNRNLKLGIISSQIIIIFMFLFFPRIDFKSDSPKQYFEPVITLLDIPSTEQSINDIPPPPPLPSISNSENYVLDDLELLEDLQIEENEKISDSKSLTNGIEKGTSEKVYEWSALPFIPRQILEVLPEKIDGGKGSIKLKLLIGKDGKVKSHQIINDKTNKSECGQAVVKAAYNSKWQPIVIESTRVEYWVEKTYSFE